MPPAGPTLSGPAGPAGSGLIASGRASGLPAYGVETADTRSRDFMSFRPQKLPFQLEVAAVSAEGAARRDDAVAWHARVAAFAHDRPDCPPRPRGAGSGGDVAVRGDPSRRDAAHRQQHPPPEFRDVAVSHEPPHDVRARAERRTRQRPTTTFARNVTPPRLVSSKAVDTPLGSSPIAFGTVVHCTSPAAPSQRLIRISAPPRR